jgi:hypothetical protein
MKKRKWALSFREVGYVGVKNVTYDLIDLGDL